MDDNKIKIKVERHLWPDEIKSRNDKRTKFILIALALLMSFSFGFVLSSSFKSPTVETDTQLTRLQQIMDVINDSWYFGTDYNDLEDQLVTDAINGMLEKLGDPYTVYFTKEELEDFSNSINLGYVGIGVSFFVNNGQFIIERVFLNSPADGAGVQSGDIIHKVNGTDVTGMTTDELVELVTGDAGTVVSIEFLRENTPIVKDITRGRINSTVYGKVLEPGVGYIELFSFGDTTGQEFEDYLETFKTQNIDRLILDLRNNGGGSLSALIDVASTFLPKNDIILQQKYVDGSIEVNRSTGNLILDFSEVIVLVNENSASASEVLTAALQESYGATILGTTTFGKGLVQSMQPFSDGSALKYTVAAWLTPLGNTIHEIGVIPDVEVTLHPALSEEFFTFENDEVFIVDTVSPAVQDLQLSLDFMGYTVDRTDGYFSVATETALNQFLSDLGETPDGQLTKDRLATVQAAVIRTWYLEKDTKDLQLLAALDLIHD
jgi:carboxyl-terminal processing protease